MTYCGFLKFRQISEKCISKCLAWQDIFFLFSWILKHWQQQHREISCWIISWIHEQILQRCHKTTSPGKIRFITLLNSKVQKIVLDINHKHESISERPKGGRRWFSCWNVLISKNMFTEFYCWVFLCFIERFVLFYFSWNSFWFNLRPKLDKIFFSWVV